MKPSAAWQSPKQLRSKGMTGTALKSTRTAVNSSTQRCPTSSTSAPWSFICKIKWRMSCITRRWRSLDACCGSSKNSNESYANRVATKPSCRRSSTPKPLQKPTFVTGCLASITSNSRKNYKSTRPRRILEKPSLYSLLDHRHWKSQRTSRSRQHLNPKINHSTRCRLCPKTKNWWQTTRQYKALLSSCTKTSYVKKCETARRRRRFSSFTRRTLPRQSSPRSSIRLKVVPTSWLRWCSSSTRLSCRNLIGSRRM